MSARTGPCSGTRPAGRAARTRTGSPSAVAAVPGRGTSTVGGGGTQSGWRARRRTPCRCCAGRARAATRRCARWCARATGSPCGARRGATRRPARPTGAGNSSRALPSWFGRRGTRAPCRSSCGCCASASAWATARRTGPSTWCCSTTTPAGPSPARAPPTPWTRRDARRPGTGRTAHGHRQRSEEQHVSVVPDWFVFRGTADPHDGIDRLPEPPPWREFDGGPPLTEVPPLGSESTRRLGAARPPGARPVWRTEELELINAALYLRRPLLVTGDPGAGKSTLAHALAHELGLGRVLRWPVVSRTTLRDGLYAYDAIARLQDAQLAARDHGQVPGQRPAARPDESIGRYLRLGPLGTALLPYERPRVLLVDELDKSDIDLPNDLLNVLEEGEFTLPELERIADREPETDVLTDDGTRARVRGGRVRCRAFPVVVLTSNGERDFPAPLLRRCLRLDLASPANDQAGAERLAAMVHAHFGNAGDGGDGGGSGYSGYSGNEEREALIREFLTSSPGALRAADQLLNAVYLTQRATPGGGPDRERLAELLMRPLDSSGEHGNR
ncbi:hypothetical protein DEH18_27565 [Streptomyces sp. NHF165]|nr:hypothetical protein DEH18_27565 [Streptomyces sp. NHF165]